MLFQMFSLQIINVSIIINFTTAIPNNCNNVKINSTNNNDSNNNSKNNNNNNENNHTHNIEQLPTPLIGVIIPF